MIELEFYRDDDGSPRAQGEDGNTLAQFLESDIQDDPGVCSELLKRIKNCQSGEAQSSSDFIGNSFTLHFNAEEVTFTCHASINNGVASLRLESVQQALQDWQKFID